MPNHLLPPFFYVKEIQLHAFHRIRSAYDPVGNQGISNLQHFSMNPENISMQPEGMGVEGRLRHRTLPF